MKRYARMLPPIPGWMVPFWMFGWGATQFIWGVVMASLGDGVFTQRGIAMTTETKRVPDHPRIGRVVSNYNGVVDREIAERLKAEDAVAEYPAWDFFALVWFEDGLYHAEVMRRGVYVDTVSAPSVRLLREECSNRWGWE